MEYISALHQCGSMAEIRQDCSIRSNEIATFLKSRHGLCVAPEVVRKFILQDGLTADKDDEDDEDALAPDSDGSDLIVPNEHGAPNSAPVHDTIIAGAV